MGQKKEFAIMGANSFLLELIPVKELLGTTLTLPCIV